MVAAEVCGVLLGDQDGGGSGSSGRRATFKATLVALIVQHYNEEAFGRFLSLLRSVALHDARVMDTTMLHRLAFVLP